MIDFVNITSDNNWFKNHPEKIAGEEFESTSFMFPIQVKGTREDVQRVINLTLKRKGQNNKLALAKAKAKALNLKVLMQ